MINENLVEAQNYARRTAQKMLRTYPDDVEDVLQDAAIKAIRGIHGFRGDAQFNSWFTAIVIREALMRLRKGRTNDSRLVDINDETPNSERRWELPDPGPSPEQVAIGNEMAQVIRREVEAMPPARRREAGLLLLGVPARSDGARKTRRFHAREHLRRALTRRGMVGADRA